MSIISIIQRETNILHLFTFLERESFRLNDFLAESSLVTKKYIYLHKSLNILFSLPINQFRLNDSIVNLKI